MNKNDEGAGFWRVKDVLNNVIDNTIHEKRPNKF